MFSKHKNKPTLDLEQHEQIEYAQNQDPTEKKPVQALCLVTDR